MLVRVPNSDAWYIYVFVLLIVNSCEVETFKLLNASHFTKDPEVVEDELSRPKSVKVVDITRS